MTGDVPLITFDEAQEVGRELHDHWHALAGSVPFPPDAMAWPDIVQFVLRKAREAQYERQLSGIDDKKPAE